MRGAVLIGCVVAALLGAATTAGAATSALPPDLQALIAKSNGLTVHSLREVETGSGDGGVQLFVPHGVIDLEPQGRQTFELADRPAHASRYVASPPRATFGQVVEERDVDGHVFDRYTHLGACDGGRPWVRLPRNHSIYENAQAPLRLLGRGPLQRLIDLLGAGLVTEIGPVSLGSQQATAFQTVLAPINPFPPDRVVLGATTVTFDVSAAGLPLRVSFAQPSTVLGHATSTFVTVTLSGFNSRLAIGPPPASRIAGKGNVACIISLLPGG